MLRTVLIDDEPHGLKVLELLISKYIPRLDLIGVTSSPGQGLELINNLCPQLIFLDINMPALNGFELLEKVTYPDFHVIFTTAHSEYALRALKKNAIDYLLKPLDLEDIQQAVERAIKKVEEQQRQIVTEKTVNNFIQSRKIRVPLPTKNSIEFLSPEEVVYIEANVHVSLVRTICGKLLSVIKPLKEYEALLCGKEINFMRINNSFIINLNYLSKYIREDGGYAVLQCKKTIPISKQKKEEFLRAINFVPLSAKYTVNDNGSDGHFSHPPQKPIVV